MRYTREQFINGLRDLAAFLEERPEVPTPVYSTPVQVSAEYDVPAEHGVEVFERVEFAARVMGTRARYTDDRWTHYEALVSFGPLRYFVLAITPEHMRRYEEEQRLGREAYDRLHTEPAALPDDACCWESKRLGDACAQCQISATEADALVNNPEGWEDSWDRERAADIAATDEQERQGREIDTAAEATGHLPGWMPEVAA